MKSIFKKIISWANDRNIIKGSTAQQQFPKLLEEVIELYATLNPEQKRNHIEANLILIILDLGKKGKIKQAPPGKKVTDDIGDIMVVATIIATQEELTVAECLECAYDDIKDRKGEMRSGIFVKEADL